MLRALQVSGLFVYPVKSFQRIALAEAFVERRGLRGDRRWMAVDSNGVFMTQRKTPQMATVQVGLSEGAISLTGPDMSLLTVAAPNDGPKKTVKVWSSTVEARDAGDEAATWISAALGTQCRLVWMPDEALRQTDQDFSQPGDHVSFADGYPLLLTTEASLADLNRRLADSIPMERFRPNVVLDGELAWDEDSWACVRIGEVEFRNAKPCGRCIVTTIDQDTGERRGTEPLTTLATFRHDGKHVNFGINLIPDREGWIRVGDEVEVLPP